MSITIQEQRQYQDLKSLIESEFSELVEYILVDEDIERAVFHLYKNYASKLQGTMRLDFLWEYEDRASRRTEVAYAKTLWNQYIMTIWGEFTNSVAEHQIDPLSLSDEDIKKMSILIVNARLEN